MSPLNIRILLHYYSYTHDYDGAEPASFIEELASMDLLQRSYEKNRSWKLTDRGLVYVEYLLSIPLPEQRWIITAPLPVTAS